MKITSQMIKEIRERTGAPMMQCKTVLQETGTHVMHCPCCNLKLSSGIARIPEMLARGISVAIGSDVSRAADRTRRARGLPRRRRRVCVGS